ncbi:MULTISPECIES: DNA-binding protein [Ramlibacter]|uniref:KfrA N-terminal DNA-binding domain-containing protein n=1 Tax=Ramlibacter pinisoli TaxID=2682844 RepID=A0A6N8IZS2_9BURK|nr:MULTISPECIES: DNA-binding protein [Ramlibacter]MBA2962119.1 DNA-binding protein [Ramlibacter sp. CGMCC 1.13660]MVQ32062.1 hypothetical protein [Ramlibacter pinisoli]
MKKLATKEAVFAACDELHAQGVEPTLRRLQARTGGSYSSIGPELEKWNEERNAAPPPPEIAARTDRFARVLWRAAKEEADRQVQQLRQAAQTQVQKATSELTFAQEHIGQLERQGEQLQQQLTIALQTIERERSHGHFLTQRLDRLEAQNSQVTQALELARTQAQEQLARAATLEGQCESLRQQLLDAMARLQGTQPAPKQRRNAAT